MTLLAVFGSFISYIYSGELYIRLLVQRALWFQRVDAACYK